jgi:hypothetical protein
MFSWVELRGSNHIQNLQAFDSDLGRMFDGGVPPFSGALRICVAGLRDVTVLRL